MGESIKINAKTLEQDGFDSDNPGFQSLVAALPDKEIIGYAIFFPSYSTWLGRAIFLEDLYVEENYRKQGKNANITINGIGKKLFLAVAKLAHESPSQRLDFHVLNWNPAIEFYKNFGATDLTVTEKWHMFRMDKDCLDKLFQ